MVMIKNVFLLGRNEGLRNRQLLMNTSETADEREASCAASGRLFGRLLSREFVSAVTWDYILLRG